MCHWPCDWDGCERPAAQRAGDCLLCDSHLCRTHRREPWHGCPTPEKNWDAYAVQYAATEARHVDNMLQKIDPDKLCSRASSLRGGSPCTVDLSRKSLSSMMGNQNCHAEVTFDDQVKWLAQFRLGRASSPPREVCDWILQSEAATMIYLQQDTHIPTPKIYDWACESDPKNGLGVDYILMAKLDGKPLDWREITTQQEKILQQLVTMFLEIEKHPFDAMGSLGFETGGDIGIRGTANQSTCCPGKGPLDPFPSLLDGSQALLDAYLAMIASGEIDSDFPVDTYLVHRHRKDLIAALTENMPADKQFFLKHPDDKGDHILVNDSFDIIGIIDWEWTQTVSKAEAFSSPCMMWPIGEFYDGSNELAADELRLAAIFRGRGRHDLANFVVNGRKVQRFFFGLGVEGSFLDVQTFQNLFAGLQRAFDMEDEDWVTWKSKALEMWKDDCLLLEVLEEEKTLIRNFTTTSSSN